ncbi:MAG: glycosyltransferase [Bdellovibrio sp.]
MKKIVISGINFSEGGPLSVYKDCLNCLSDNFSNEFEIIALVHDKGLFSDISNISFIEFKDSKRSYLRRLFYEYFYFKKLSKIMKPYLWFSIHDVTPNVNAEKRAVYCHNPMPFYNISFREFKFGWKGVAFNFLYKYLYKINIKKNDWVVVQQDWLRTGFKKQFGVQDVIVAYPNIEKKNTDTDIIVNTDQMIFFYPSFPRFFKNFEVVCEASEILEKRGIRGFKSVVTISGKENVYSKSVFERYKHLNSIDFKGLISRDEVYETYKRANVMIFPSKIETWGLPITEFKGFNKPMILSNLEYAKEALGNYDKAIFFNPWNPQELADIMEKFIKEEKIQFEEAREVKVAQPFAESWKELFDKILGS